MMDRTHTLGVLAVLAMAMALPLPALALPTTLPIQGVLRDGNGSKAPDGTYELSFAMFDAASGGESLWVETSSVAVANGVFLASLGAETPLEPSLFATQSALWMEMSVDGDPPLPRWSLGAEAFAFHAGSAEVAQVAEALQCSGCVTLDMLSDDAQPSVAYADADVQAWLDSAGYVGGPHAVDTDTQLSLAQVLEMIAGAGYVGGEHTVDTDTQLSVEDVLAMVVGGGYEPGAHTEDTDTQLSVEQVLEMVADADYVSGQHTVDTDTQLTAVEVLQMVLDGGYVSGAHTVDTDTDTQLTAAQVLQMVVDGGYVSGP
ncbi:MAG: hypothetical protein ACI9WU_000397, partial [Myxococcota bacterium]